MQVTATYTTLYSTTLVEGDDQTIAIRDFLAAVPDGTTEAPTVIRFDAGRYHTEGDLANNPRGAKGVIALTNRHNLIIEGPSPTDPAIFYTEAPAVPYGASVSNNTHSLRRHFWLKGCSNIVIRNIRVEGSNYTRGVDLANGTPPFWLGGPDNGSSSSYPGYRACWELEHAFDVTDSTNVLLDSCQSDATWGDGCYIGNSPNSGSNGVTLLNCYFNRTGRQGIAMANCCNILLDSVKAERGRRAAVDMEPYSDDGFVTDVEIRNCNFTALQTHFAALGKGDVSRINIHDNTSNGAGALIICAATPGTRRTDWTLRNHNRISGYGSPNAAACAFNRVDNITIDGNTIPIATSQSRKCVSFDSCNGVLAVTNNNFKPGGRIIEAIDSAPVTNTGNTFG